MSNHQEMYEANTHVFVVKIWLEESAADGGQAVWRGYITHPPDGERRYIHDLSEMIDFILPYLESMGVKPSLPDRLRAYLRSKR